MVRMAAAAGAAALLLAACQTYGGEDAVQATPAKPVGGDTHALAQAACGGCHSIERFGLSANPEAPEFPTIANRPGLTIATLTNWLRDAHNYPEEMDFYLDDDEVAALANYILTLEDEDYQPPI
ncbi:c-type cytochrome [Alteraurantiacibacter aquimixticola]|uniref:Cytochrome c domain-containing protein n=1 Tax=Alteraurantiacibacter aquimixticola TaxID=2489173 RepID=A0A4T3F2D8_9SPHN|nr:cytochrome c [Alteraurantiacibacter aquimixticola]TIX51356.1 hypothetical protein E5222_02505 [Alteraurantiacibacter aquimixticola]